MEFPGKQRLLATLVLSSLLTACGGGGGGDNDDDGVAPIHPAPYIDALKYYFQNAARYIDSRPQLVTGWYSYNE